jgi:hypothetical protein
MAKKPQTVRVLNRSHTSLTLTEPPANPEKPGASPVLRSVSLAGNGAVSEVDAETYNAWKKGNPNHAFIANGILEEVGDDYRAPEEVFGHEPALEAAAKDKTEADPAVNVEAGPGELTASDMTPVNNTPPGDDAGEPRHASQPGEPEPPRRGRRSAE